MMTTLNPNDLCRRAATWGSSAPSSYNSCALSESFITDGPPASRQTADYFCNLYDFVIEAILMGVLCLFGFVGNTLSTICLWRDKSKSATPFLLVSLELFDTLFLVTVLLLRVLTSIDTFSPGLLQAMPTLVPFLGIYVYPCALIAETGTIYMTILVTVNRYVAVCRPYDVRQLGSVNSARLHVVMVTFFSVLFNAPRFFEYDVIEQNNGTSAAARRDAIPSDGGGEAGGGGGGGGGGEGAVREVPVPRELEPTWLLKDNVYQIVYSNILYFVAMFFVPLVSLVFLNWRLMVTLRRTRRRRESMRRRSDASTSSGNSRFEDDITMMLIVVVVVFVVTQSPALITQVLANVLGRHDEELLMCGHPFFYYARISDLLVVLNSSINFVIYCLCSRRFRQILIKILCRLGDFSSVSSSFASPSAIRRARLGSDPANTAASVRRKSNLGERRLTQTTGQGGVPPEAAVVVAGLTEDGLSVVGKRASEDMGYHSTMTCERTPSMQMSNDAKLMMTPRVSLNDSNRAVTSVVGVSRTSDMNVYGRDSNAGEESGGCSARNAGQRYIVSSV